MNVEAKAGPVPIIVLTAVEDGAMAFECLEVGAYAYIVKGQVDPGSLSSLVIRAASTHGEMGPRPAAASHEPVPDRSGFPSNETAIGEVDGNEESHRSRVVQTAPPPESNQELYRGTVAIEVESPGGVTQTVPFLTRIRSEPGLRVVLQTGSQRRTKLLVELIAPTTLKCNLSKMAGVGAVQDTGSSQSESGLTVLLG